MPQPVSTQTKIAADVARILLLTFIGYVSIKWLLSRLDPTNKTKMAAKKQAEVLLKSIGVKDVELSEYEMTIAANLVNPFTLPISWEDIGGLDETISEIRENVVLPFRNRKIFASSSLLSPPRGVLFYGPPGCGKTMIAKATAKEAGCRFINLDLSSLTDKWYGESQKLARAVFSLAYKIQPCIIFIDEIDSFLRSRATHDHEATAMMKAQFMCLWDGLLSSSSVEIVIMGATNRPQDVDKAILRRMPCRFHIGMPIEDQRLSIMEIILEGEKLQSDVDLRELARITEGYSGSDLRELCRVAALYCVRDINLAEQESENSMEDLRPLSMDDFRKGINKNKLSTEHLANHGIFNSF